MSLHDALAKVGLDQADLRHFVIGGETIPFFLTEGERAGAYWEHLRRDADTSGHWPVILGAPAEIDLAIERGEASPSVAELLAEAATTAIDPKIWARESHDRRRAFFHDRGIHLLCEKPSCDRGREPVEDAPNDDATEVDVDVPNDVQPLAGVTTTHECTVDPEKGLVYRPLPEVAIALVPSPRPWEAAAYLRFGGFNGCPFSKEHVALHRHFYEEFGAAVFAVTHDVLELVVERPPEARAEVLALARLQRSYAEDWDTTSLGYTAARLRNARVWHFWWD